MKLELGVELDARLLVDLRNFDEDVIKELRVVTKLWGTYCKSLTQSFCPVDKGYMRSKVRARFINRGTEFEVGWDYGDFAGYGNGSFYPFFQEFGTVNHGAQPSLTPAYGIVKPLYEADVKRVVSLAARRFNRRVR